MRSFNSCLFTSLINKAYKHKQDIVQESISGLEDADEDLMSLAEGVEVARIAEEAGFAALTPVTADALPNSSICRGDFPGRSFDSPAMRKRLLSATGTHLRSAAVYAGLWLAARKYPFTPLWNRDVFAAVKAAVQIPVFAVGGIRTPQEAADILARGQADMIGIGRPFYAEPELAARFLAEAERPSATSTACESCNRCLVPQMLGMPGVCYNPEIHKIRKPRGPGERSSEPSSEPPKPIQKVA